MNVYIWQPSFATKWPCDTWFHVPTEWEMSSLISIVSWNSTDYANYLHMPLAWNRNDTWTSYNQWIRMLYWTCTPSGTDEAKLLYFYTSASLSNARRVQGCSIRPFKDIPVTPDSTWTKLKDLWWNSWIYYKSSLWLISLSSDWTNWITISDKNLWATSVYYNANTLSESNCWKYYQWWNNYGFAWTWSVTTSNTKVNTTGYWPWNYYSGSTFILSSSSPYDWSSTQNDNLWWWTDGNIQINTELKNAYIGGVYEYSYDFRGKTKTQVTNDWWSAWTWDSWTSCWSNWLYQTSNQSWWRLIRQFNVDMSNAKKITMSAQIYASNTSSWWCTWSIATSSARANNTAVYIGNDAKNMQVAWTVTTINPTLSLNTYKWEYIIDLENKTATVTFLTWSTYTNTISITDSQINTIRNNNIYWPILVWNYGYLQTVSITVN